MGMEDTLVYAYSLSLKPILMALQKTSSGQERFGLTVDMSLRESREDTTPVDE